jgi:hypothetical protein
MEGALADKSTQLVLEALSRAALDPTGLPLFRQKSAPGLFRATTLARQAAQRCKEQDLLRVVRTEPCGKSIQEVCTITPKGLDHLLRQSNPRQVLDDLLRAVESREKQLGEIVAAVRQTQAGLEGLRGLVAIVLERLEQPAPRTTAATTEACDQEILKYLDDWHTGNASKDCPLPSLFRALTANTPALTTGQFHDALRELHERGQIYLHPWTGPLYDLPEPPFALLAGHEVAYYASLRPLAV